METPQNHEEEKRIEKPKQFKCGGCGESDQTTYENTVYFRYENELNKNHLRVACDTKNFWNILWVDYRDEERSDWAEQFILMTDQDEDGNDIPLTICQDEQITEMWKEHAGIQPIPEYDLTPRLETHIGFLAYLLATRPSEEILDEFHDPQPPRTAFNKWC